VRSVLVALPIEYIAEIMRPLPVESLEAMPEFVAGLAVVRGEPTPVVDSGVLLAIRDRAEWTRFVAVRTAGRLVVLAVEAVLGVRDLDIATLQALPALLGQASAELVEAVGSHDRELMFVLDAARLIPASLWRSVDALGTSA
jgi:purine-binding chemotaxis protein CheW